MRGAGEDDHAPLVHGGELDVWFAGVFLSGFSLVQATQDKDGSAHSNNGPEPPPPLPFLLGETCLINRQFKMRRETRVEA